MSLRNLYQQLKTALSWQYRRAKLCQRYGCVIEPGSRIKFPENILLAEDIKIGSGVLIHCGDRRVHPERANIIIKKNSYIGPNSILFGDGEIEIGAHCEIAPGVVITSRQHTFDRIDIPIRHQPSSFAKIVIENDVWIGCNASILPGVTIGKSSIIGAGAVVTRDIPAYSIAMGIPAKVIRQRK
ncbi:MAG: acyltransferase [Candidatus Omnitrophica bacterium]|nr:acyltransferase [Candidatus Omnitrophota bacterium]